MSIRQTLLSPLKIGRTTFKNRIVSTAHAPGYADAGMPGERYILYHEAKARGGVGLTMIGGSSIVSAEVSPIYNQLDVSHDEIIPHFAALAKRIHAYDANVMCQISHMGRRTAGDDGDWVTPVAPSSVRDPAHHSVPRALEAEEINRIVRSYGAAAARCAEGVLDGCEVLVPSHLPGQFLAASSNLRDDSYGGSLENRMRFLKQVLLEIRASVPADFLVSLRMAIDESAEGGPDRTECLEVAQRLRRAGLYDLLNLIGTSGATTRGLSDIISPMSAPLGGWLDQIRSFRTEIDAPVLHAARIADVSTGAHAIQSGAADLIGMTRAHFADPDIVRKLENDRGHEIRPCVGASFCIDRIYSGRASLCIHNPATGREASLPHRLTRSAAAAKKVVVVGGGPAGMEAARVAAERGHEVVLFEAASQLGGQVLLSARAPLRRDMRGIADWLSQELDRLCVEIRTSTFADLDMVLAESPDVVIIATGGIPRNSPFSPELVLSTWDVLSAPPTGVGTALVYDEDGGHSATSVADLLATLGVAVTLATPDRVVGRELGGSNYPVYLGRFAKGGVTLLSDRRLARVDRLNNQRQVLLTHEYADVEQTLTADLVIAEFGTAPADELYHELKRYSVTGGITDLEALVLGFPQPAFANVGNGLFAFFKVGDAEASRGIHAAMHDSLRIMKDC